MIPNAAPSPLAVYVVLPPIVIWKLALIVMGTLLVVWLLAIGVVWIVERWF